MGRVRRPVAPLFHRRSQRRRPWLRGRRVEHERRPLRLASAREAAAEAAVARRPRVRVQRDLLQLSSTDFVQTGDPLHGSSLRLCAHQVARVRLVGRHGYDREEAVLAAVDERDFARLAEVEHVDDARLRRFSRASLVRIEHVAVDLEPAAHPLVVLLHLSHDPSGGDHGCAGGARGRGAVRCGAPRAFTGFVKGESPVQNSSTTATRASLRRRS
mmetsp:Transcript_18765/g.63380  ORF Transcript_18765/g.63380 Transcript_18765/m.63380 type:complete len:215 (-) Transcript_18765:8-652(-)